MGNAYAEAAVEFAVRPFLLDTRSDGASSERSFQERPRGGFLFKFFLKILEFVSGVFFNPVMFLLPQP